MVSISGALRRIKQEVLEPLGRTVIEEVCRELKHVWRGGPLDPANTVALFVRQIVEGNISCEQVRHLGDGEPFTAAAYCQARQVVMMEGARRQRVGVDRIGFADALAWVRHAQADAELPDLVVNPHRPDRVEPRAVKRRPKEYDRLTKPREELRKALRNKEKSC